MYSIFENIGLIINDCDENDTGEYTITIDNNKSSTAKVIVEPMVEQSPSPSTESEAEEVIKTGFRQLLPTQLKADEDNDFILECEVHDVFVISCISIYYHMRSATQVHNIPTQHTSRSVK